MSEDGVPGVTSSPLAPLSTEGIPSGSSLLVCSPLVFLSCRRLISSRDCSNSLLVCSRDSRNSLLVCFRPALATLPSPFRRAPRSRSSCPSCRMGQSGGQSEELSPLSAPDVAAGSPRSGFVELQTCLNFSIILLAKSESLQRSLIATLLAARLGVCEHTEQTEQTGSAQGLRPVSISIWRPGCRVA